VVSVKGNIKMYLLAKNSFSDRGLGMSERKRENTSFRSREVRPMYGEIEWLKVKSLARQGYGFKPIGRKLGLDWRTVKKLFYMPAPPQPRPRERASILDNFKPIIDGWLGLNPQMMAVDIERKLRSLGYEGSYSTVKRYGHFRKEEIFREATVRFETLPGQQAQVDFAVARAHYVDGSEDKVVIYFFLLSFSRWKEADISENQRRKALMYRMEQTFWKIGGVAKEVLFDNLAPVAARARTLRSEGELAEEWQRFEAYYGFKTRLSMAYRAQTKGKVERPIEPVKRFIESGVFLSRGHLRRELHRYIQEENEKVHSTTRERPVERLAKEREFLLPLPEKSLDLARVERRWVSKDCFISVDGVRYSVPWEYVGKLIEVRITKTEVQLFTLRGSLIGSHRRLPVSLRNRYGVNVKDFSHHLHIPKERANLLILRVETPLIKASWIKAIKAASDRFF